MQDTPGTQANTSQHGKHTAHATANDPSPPGEAGLACPSIVVSHAEAAEEAAAKLAAASSAAQSAFNASLLDLFQGWVDGSLLAHGPHDEVSWFLSKRAHALIDDWLMNKKLAALEVVSPTGTGCIVIARNRVEHVRDSRTTKDSVALAGVVELLGQLFVHGHPKYAPNPGYPNQLLMFDANYKAIDLAAKGESPVAALRFEGAPMAHFRLETAYWMKPAKAQALVSQALTKKK